MLCVRGMFFVVILVVCAFGEMGDGESLFNEGSCLECHDASHFANEKKKIRMFKQLEDRVQACQLANNDGWFDDEVHDVAKYLNKEHYKLKK